MIIAMLIKILLEQITIASVDVNIVVGYLNFFIYFLLKNIFHGLKMNAEDLLQDLPKDTTQDAAMKQKDAKKKDCQPLLLVVAANKILRT